MDDDTTPVRLGDTLSDDFLLLSRAAMSDVGPAAQTLAAVYLLAKRTPGAQTFTRQEMIGEWAGLPRRTVQAHLRTLIDAEWLDSAGRELLGKSSYRRRRTVTLGLTAKAQNKREPFATLPRWAATRLNTWSERAVLAVLVSALQLADAVERDEAGCADERQFLNVRTIAKFTGLSLPSIRAARAKLDTLGMIVTFDGDPAWQHGAKMAANPDYELGATDVPGPVNRKGLAYPFERASATKNLRIPRKNPAHTQEKSCADVRKNLRIPRKNPAHTQKDPALTCAKSCAPLYKNLDKNLLLEPVCKNPVKESNGQKDDKNVRAVEDSGSHAYGFDHLDLFVTDPEKDSRVAGDIFHRLAYNGPAEFVWQVACLYRCGQLSENQYTSAANGVATAQTTIGNPLGYFRTTLAESIGGKAKLDALLARVRNPAKLADPPRLGIVGADERQRRGHMGHEANGNGHDPTPIGVVIDKIVKRVEASAPKRPLPTANATKPAPLPPPAPATQEELQELQRRKDDTLAQLGTLGANSA